MASRKPLMVMKITVIIIVMIIVMIIVIIIIIIIIIIIMIIMIIIMIIICESRLQGGAEEAAHRHRENDKMTPTRP